MKLPLIARWRGWSDGSLEHLVLLERPGGIVAEAAILGASSTNAYAARYRICCDRDWHVRNAEIALIGNDQPLKLMSDGQGHWVDGHCIALAQFNGALDIDLTATPFTNTLPIRRLNLSLGVSKQIDVIYVRLPELEVTIDRQQYTCIEPMKRYRFKSFGYDFVEDIDVDEDGLIVTYPGLFKRLL